MTLPTAYPDPALISPPAGTLPPAYGAVSVSGVLPPAYGDAAALNLNFTSNNALDSRITFSRASNATYFDSTGTLQTAGSGVARANAFQDHNPSTLAPLGFLIEEQRTNSIRNNTMQGAVAGTPGTLPTNWVYFVVAGGLTRTIVGTGVESGIEYMDVRISGTTTGANGVTFCPDFGAAATGQSWTASMYWRIVAGSTTGVTSWALGVIENTSGGVFVTGAFYPQTAPTSAGLATQRAVATRTLSGGATVAQAVHVPQINIPNSTAVDFTLRIGLPQLEQGAFATSVIKTTTAAAVRLADSASMTGTNFSSWYRQSEGTFVTRSDTLSLAASRGVFAAGDATLAFGAAETIYLAYESSLSGRLVASNLDGGVQQFFLGPVVAQAVNTPATFAVAYKLNDSAATVSGNTPVTDGTCTVPTPTSISIGSLASGWSGAANNLNGHIQRLTYYRTRLPNTTLQALTA